MIKNFFKYWPLLIIIIFGIALRLIKLEELFYFTYDESIPAFVARRLILWQHIPLIGGVTPFGFHLAPYFYWFLAILLFIGQLNPIIWGLAGAFIATATVLMIYLVGRSFFNRRVAITAAIFWAFSYLANVYDRHLWALYWGPLVSLVVLYSLYQIVFKNKQKYLYLVALTLALAIHADFSNLIFIVLTAVVWTIYKLPIKKTTIISIFIIIASFFPLVIFDLRHNFANTRPAIDYFRAGLTHKANNPQDFWQNSLLFPQVASRLIYKFGDDEMAKNYSYCWNLIIEKLRAIPPVVVLLSAFILIAFVVIYIRKSQPPQLIAILLVIYFGANQLFGTVFRSDVFEHYLAGLFAALLIIVAAAVCILPRKLWILALYLFIFFNLYKFSNIKNSLGFTYKRQAIEFTMKEVGQKPFSLDSLSTCWKYNGYRYLFTVFGREPVKSYVDPNFAYLYGTTPVAEKHPETVVTFVIHDFVPETSEFYKRYTLLKSHEVQSALFGNIEVIIMDNSSGWFD